MDIYYGIYDVASAIVVSKYTNNMFLSGLSFAASYYGLPDIGYVTWQDMVGFCARVTQRIPNVNLLVDIDDGYGGPEVASHVIKSLKQAGAFGVVLEDQLRPKKCGHFSGKRVQPLPQYLETLQAVLENKNELFVIARTDAEEYAEQIKRVEKISEFPVDAILVDGINLETLIKLKKVTQKPLCFNFLEGGRSGNFSHEASSKAGASLMLVSSPCLLAATDGIENKLQQLHLSIKSNIEDRAVIAV